jgi:outer membrane protein OmpA-like peptidoglycan-associated protein
MAIGQRRAEAVRLFMSKQGVPLNRMSAISYGETAPVAANTTRDGRSANRRVTIIVLN